MLPPEHFLVTLGAAKAITPVPQPHPCPPQASPHFWGSHSSASPAPAPGTDSQGFFLSPAAPEELKGRNISIILTRSPRAAYRRGITHRCPPETPLELPAPACTHPLEAARSVSPPNCHPGPLPSTFSRLPPAARHVRLAAGHGQPPAGAGARETATFFWEKGNLIIPSSVS